MRASRLLAILIMLQLRGRVTAEVLAAEFEVSVRTIYRDIDALSAAGVPVYGDSGPGGGFALLDGYSTRLTGLDAQEAGALPIIGLPQAARDLGLGLAAERARDKLLAALPEAGRREAGRVAGRFHLDPIDWYRAARPTPHLADVARAVFEQRQLAMVYTSWTGRRDWLVDPHGLVMKGGAWYLVASGHGKIRSFAVADIEMPEVKAEPAADPPPYFSLSQWWTQSTQDFEARLRPGRARLRASPLGLQRLRLLGAFAAEAVAAAGPSDAAGWCEVLLPLETIEAAAPQLLGIGPELAIIEPAGLREEVARLARAVVTRMEEQTG